MKLYQYPVLLSLGVFVIVTIFSFKVISIYKEIPEASLTDALSGIYPETNNRARTDPKIEDFINNLVNSYVKKEVIYARNNSIIIGVLAGSLALVFAIIKRKKIKGARVNLSINEPSDIKKETIELTENKPINSQENNKNSKTDHKRFMPPGS